VAIEGENMYAYPLFDGTLTVQGFYRKPSAMASASSTLDLPYDTISPPLVVYGVVGKYIFPIINEFEKAKFYYNTVRTSWGMFQREMSEYIRMVNINASEETVKQTYY
jgi:hypothetical protein